MLRSGTDLVLAQAEELSTVCLRVHLHRCHVRLDLHGRAGLLPALDWGQSNGWAVYASQGYSLRLSPEQDWSAKSAPERTLHLRASHINICLAGHTRGYASGLASLP